MTLLDPDLLAEGTTFAELGLDQRLVDATEKLGWSTPSLVQAVVIDKATEGKDILARAKTGSGKTAAYVLPVINKLLEDGNDDVENLFAVILVPTRELCDQVRAQILELSIYVKDKVKVESLASDEQGLLLKSRNPNILVSTPGRLAEHLKKKTLSLQNLRALVIDEADLILSYGYKNDLAFIADDVPDHCQNFLLSATLNSEVDALKEMVLHRPAVIKLQEEDVNDDLEQFSIRCKKDEDKFLILLTLVQLKLIRGKSLFFTNTIDRAFKLKLFLERFSIRSAVLNSELPQNSRNHILQEFNRGLIDFLIATDETFEEDSKRTKGEKKEKKVGKKDKEYGVSRGFDFKGVKTVINFDCPTSATAYVHRIGRTARGGAQGSAVVLVTDSEVDLFKEIANTQVATHGEDAIQPYAFKMELIERFRYRVEDMLRSVTRVAIREARISELKSEILNSEKLKAHFEDNPRDLDVLKHDRPLQQKQVRTHLKTPPSYLVPERVYAEGEEPASVVAARSAAERRHRDDDSAGGSAGRKRRYGGPDHDPLKSLSYNNDRGGKNGARKKTHKKKYHKY